MDGGIIICSICMELLGRSDLTCAALKCGHVFHMQCLEKYCDLRGNQTVCPSCRNSLVIHMCRLFFHYTDADSTDEMIAQLNNKVKMYDHLLETGAEEIKSLKQTNAMLERRLFDCNNELFLTKNRTEQQVQTICQLQNEVIILKNSLVNVKDLVREYQSAINLISVDTDMDSAVEITSPELMATTIKSLRRNYYDLMNDRNKVSQSLTALDNENSRLKNEIEKLKKQEETHLTIIGSLKETLVNHRPSTSPVQQQRSSVVKQAIQRHRKSLRGEVTNHRNADIPLEGMHHHRHSEHSEGQSANNHGTISVTSSNHKSSLGKMATLKPFRGIIPRRNC